jgi:hypothetical protein
MKESFELALDRAVVRRALICMVIVGAILITINHGGAILRGDITRGRLVQMALTLLVPYCVSTASSVAAMRSARRERQSSDDDAYGDH